MRRPRKYAGGTSASRSAETLEGLDLQSEALVGAVRRAGCQATCLYGEQELPFLATLPLCHGLAK